MGFICIEAAHPQFLVSHSVALLLCWVVANMIMAFRVFLYPSDLEALERIADVVRKSEYMPMWFARPETGRDTMARFLLLVGDGWAAHIVEEVEEVGKEVIWPDDEGFVELAEWDGDSVEVYEGAIDDYPIMHIESIDGPHIECKKDEDSCKAWAIIRYKRVKTVATIVIDLSRDVPREVIDIAIRGEPLPTSHGNA